MNAKLTKEQWMQIGTEAGWTKTAQESEALLPPISPPADTSYFETKKIPTLNEIREIVTPEEYSRVYSAINSRQDTSVNDFVNGIPNTKERYALAKKLTETCKAFILLASMCRDDRKVHSNPSNPRVAPRYAPRNTPNT